MKYIIVLFITITSCRTENKNIQNEILPVRTNSLGYKYLDIYKSKMFNNPMVYIRTIQNKDTFNIGDTLKLKFYLTDSSFQKLAVYHNITYSKSFFYDDINASLMNKKLAKMIDLDTGYVEFKVKRANLKSVNWSLGIYSKWENKDGITYDTGFIQTVSYYIK